LFLESNLKEIAVPAYLQPDYEFSQMKMVTRLGGEYAKRGICLVLCMQWLANCHTSGAGPELEFVKIQKEENPSFFRQLAANQQAVYRLWDWNASTAINHANLLQLISRGALTLASEAGEQEGHGFERLAEMVADAAASSPLRSCNISLKFRRGGPRHLITAVEDVSEYKSSTWYVFDPIFGLSICDVGLPGHTLSGLFGETWQRYLESNDPIRAGTCVPVIRSA
jgi:hypothetical protein